MFEVAKWALLILLIAAFTVWIGRVIVSTVKMIYHNESAKDQTLGYPKGTVRTFLAFAITFIVTIIVVFADAGAFDPEVAKWATGTYGAVIAFYFGSKVIEGSKKD